LGVEIVRVPLLCMKKLKPLHVTVDLGLLPESRFLWGSWRAAAWV